MTTGNVDHESAPVATDSKICEACTLPKPLTNFRPSSWKNKDGSIRRGRAKACRSCERNSRTSTDKCGACARPAAPGHTCCETCLAAIRASAKKRAVLDRLAALTHYGLKCAYCGIDRFIFLTIDHINNDGHIGRKRKSKTGNTYRTGSGHHFYAWLRKNKYPIDFQTLCYNCNCVKAQIGEEALLAILKT